MEIGIKIKKVREGAVTPEYKTEGAACFDLTAAHIEYVAPGKVKVYFGIACQIPKGYKIEIQPRSSGTLKGWVQLNSPGQVDSDYRGELMWFLDAIPNGIDKSYLEQKYPHLPFAVGERCAQGIVEEVITAKFIEVEELTETQRGTGGFGSTGKT